MKTPSLVCAFCRGPAEGNYAIHMDDEMSGPETPLCDEHGGHETPTTREIWDKIAADKAREKDIK